MSSWMRFDLCAAALAASALARKHEHLVVAGIDELLGHHPIVVKCLGDLRRVGHYALVPEDRLGEVWKLTRATPFDIRVDERAPRLQRRAQLAHRSRHAEVDGRIDPA